MRGFTDLVEDFIFSFDARGSEWLKNVFKIEIDRSLRNQAYGLLVYIRESNPFSSLPSKESNLLQTLNQALESSNKDLGISTILQLAQEIEILDSAIRTGETRARISYIISIVGIVLTTFFGLLSFTQILLRQFNLG
jgi:hypothetical protein